MQDLPKISVIIPAYQAEAFLEKCVRSVMAQDFTDWELILVDDGSSDGTAALCDRLAEEDGRIRVVHQANGGVSAARNRAMELAVGELLAFVDSDDWLAPNALSAMYDRMAADGVNTVACGNRLVYDGGTTVEEAPPLPAGVYTAEQAMKGIAAPLLCDRLREGMVNGYVWRYLFDRKVIEEAGIRFSGAYLEDELFLIEYFANGVTLSVTDLPLYNYYQNPMSVTKRYLPIFADTFLASLAMKEDLVTRYDIPVTPHWKDNTCWAGLLIAVSNEFAGGNPASGPEKRRRVKALCAIPQFAHALAHYVPEGMGRNKAIVARLLRHRMIALLSLLYAVKNRA